MDRGNRLRSTVYGPMDINMSNAFIQSLQITALGMGLVFAAIILLWWLMNLLTAITADKGVSSSHPSGALRSATASDLAESASVVDSELKAQAAAAAVALAFAEDQVSVAHPLREPPTTIVSAWQLGMRTNQLYEKRAPTIHKPRKSR